MGWILLLIVAVLLLGPLRHWAGRHWAMLFSMAFGAGFGFGIGSVLTYRFGLTPLAPLIGAAACAIEAVQVLPCVLRRLSRDGREDNDDTRRH